MINYYFVGSKQSRKKCVKPLVYTYPFATNIAILLVYFADDADDADGLHHQPTNALATPVQYKMCWQLML